MLSPDDLKRLVERLHDVQPKWYDLGLQLGVPSGNLDALEKDSPESSVAFRKMLKQWLAGKEPSLEQLSEALQTKSVGQDRLGQDILLETCELVSV